MPRLVIDTGRRLAVVDETEHEEDSESPEIAKMATDANVLQEGVDPGRILDDLGSKLRSSLMGEAEENTSI